MRLSVAISLAFLALPAAATPARCGNQAAASVPGAAAAPAASSGKTAGSAAVGNAGSVDDATAIKAAKAHPIRAALKKLSPSHLYQVVMFKRAEKAFPAFCKDWEAKLRKRERDNLSHISWKGKNGAEVGTYVGYGSVKSCECKQSSKGVPVGKLSYQEFEYELDGKTVDEARHAPPKTDGVTNTTELIGYDKKKKKWFY